MLGVLDYEQTAYPPISEITSPMGISLIRCCYFQVLYSCERKLILKRKCLTNLRLRVVDMETIMLGIISIYLVHLISLSYVLSSSAESQDERVGKGSSNKNDPYIGSILVLPCLGYCIVLMCVLYCFLKHTCCSYFIRVIHFYQSTRALFPKTLSWNEEQEIEMYTVQ